MSSTIIANTSSPHFTVDPENIKLWVNNSNTVTKPTTILLSADPHQLKGINLTLIRLAGTVECKDCSNYGAEIPDSTFGQKALGQSNTSIHITLPGRYYLYGTKTHNRPLFNDPCNPVIIEEVTHDHSHV